MTFSRSTDYLLIIKDLRVVFSSNLSSNIWISLIIKLQFLSLTQKKIRILGFVSRNSSGFFNIKTSITLCVPLVRSVFQYGSIGMGASVV